VKAIVIRAAKDFVVEDVPEPVLQPDEVMLRPLYTGICFTDKHAYEGAPGVPIRPGTVIFAPGAILGHEWTGQVVEIGTEVDKVKIGDRMAVYGSDGCGQCFGCRNGWSCQTGYRVGHRLAPDWGRGCAELCAVAESSCYSLPDSISDVQSGFIEPAGIATRAVRNSGITIGDNVAILGVEDYGMAVFFWTRLFAGKILVADPSPARRAMVEAVGGAEDIIDPTVDDPVARAKQLMGLGADVVFIANEDYVPRSYQYLRDAIRIARPGGTVVTVRHEGREELPAPISMWSGESAFTKELKVLGFGHWYGNEPGIGGRARGDYQRTIDAFATRQFLTSDWKPTVIDFADITSKSDVDDMFALLPDQAAKILIRVSGQEPAVHG